MRLEDSERRRIIRRQRGSQTQSIIQTGEFVGTDPGSGLPIVQSIDGSRFRGRSISNQGFQIGDPIQITSVNGGQLSRVDRIPEIRNRQQFVPFEQGDPFIPDRRRSLMGGLPITLSACQAIIGQLDPPSAELFEDETALCGFGIRRILPPPTVGFYWTVDDFPQDATVLNFDISGRTTAPLVEPAAFQILEGPITGPVISGTFFNMIFSESFVLETVQASGSPLLSKGQQYTFTISAGNIQREFNFIRIRLPDEP